MVNLILGAEGSGKTKQLIDAINAAVKNESGSMVCIEKGSTMRFDLDHHVRLVDAGEYAIDGYPFLKGFISGLHAGNFDISHIFLDNLFKVSHCKDVSQIGPFLDWCEAFSQNNGVSFTFTISGEPDAMPEEIRKFIK
jgi:energy-coupling factor transporter ATP-binding protein EcfA2